MNLTPIYSPVHTLLTQTEAEITRLVHDFGEPEVREVLGQFLAHPGKRIRPALLFLSAGAGNPDCLTPSPFLVKSATAFELVHSASLVHDDVIDGPEVTAEKAY